MRLYLFSTSQREVISLCFLSSAASSKCFSFAGFVFSRDLRVNFVSPFSTSQTFFPPHPPPPLCKLLYAPPPLHNHHQRFSIQLVQHACVFFFILVFSEKHRTHQFGAESGVPGEDSSLSSSCSVSVLNIFVCIFSIKNLPYFILSITKCVPNLFFSRADSSFDRMFSEPAQSRFTTALLQGLRDRNVSFATGTKWKYTKCCEYSTSVVIVPSLSVCLCFSTRWWQHQAIITFIWASRKSSLHSCPTSCEAKCSHGRSESTSYKI